MKIPLRSLAPNLLIVTLLGYVAVNDLAAQQRTPAHDYDTLRAAGNRSPDGLWSDGTTMWVVDSVDDKVYAYTVATKARDAGKDFDTLGAAGNRDPGGLWSDGTTMWVADWRDDKVYAYTVATKARDPGKDFRAAGNRFLQGLWSDGTTMWVADSIDEKVYAYTVATKARDPGKDFDTLRAAGNRDPADLWSDGTTMWVADWLDDKVYAYTVATKARDPGKDFDTLRAAGNRVPQGLWSDGTTMWVADIAADKVYAYVMPGQDAGPTNRTANELWSSTLTAESFELTGDDGTLRLVGYLWLGDVNQRGALGDPDFELGGTTHYVRGLFRDRDNWSVWLIIDPPPGAQDVRSMTLTLDDYALSVSDAPLVEEDDVLGAVVAWFDPGFRWSDGQRIAARLTTEQDGAGANQAPRASGSIPAQTLSVGGSAASVNVARYFTDPDGDTLTYSASSNRTGIVRAGASGSTVTLTPVTAGTATVTVTARDPGGLSARQSIAVTVRAPGGVGGFTDDPIRPGVTPIRAVHFTELRTRIDALRTGVGLSAFPWTDPTLRAGVTGVRSVHLTELRNALNQAYAAAGQPRPAYTDASVRPGTTPIRAAHVTELRRAVVELENTVESGGGDVVEGEITSCTGRLIASSRASITMSGIVRARVSVTSVVVTGTVDGETLGTDSLGSISAGSSKSFSISGTVSVSGTNVRCSAEVRYARASGAAAEEPGGVAAATMLEGALR